MTESSRVPVLSIQCDWNDALRNKLGEAWVSCKFRGEIGVHGKLISRGVTDDGTPDVKGSDDFVVGKVTKHVIEVTFSPTGNKCIFIAPSKVFVGIHKKSIISLGVTPSKLCVSACTDNKLQVWDASDGMLRRTLNSHLMDVYICRFFPSGVVVLSGGADMLLKIWSAETGQCPVTLRGHTAAITDMCIVNRGRNIISVSKDGTAKLWDCGESACLATLIKVDGSINCCSLGVANNKLELGEPEEAPSEREIGTEDKILVVGCEDGSVHVVAVRSRRTLLSFKLPCAVNCVAVVSEDEFVVGCHSGEVLVYGLKEYETTPMRSWFESNSAALCLLPYKNHGFFVGKADGLCIYYRLPSGEDGTGDGNHVDVRLQLTGSDFDPIYDLASDGTAIYSACRDAIVRKYDVQNIILEVFKRL